MARSICIVANSGDDGERLDSFCAKHNAYESRSAAAAAISDGKVYVDGDIRQKKYLVKAGDAVVCELSDSGIAPIQGEDIPLDIRYEDESLAVISKQKNLICHPVNEYRSGTLVNALLHKYGPTGLANVQGDLERLGIVHRLDGDTSGLMLIAKDDIAGQALMDAIALHEVDRRYLALVHGIIAPDSGLIDAPIERNPHDRKTMRVGEGANSRDAITTFKVLERFSGDGRNDGYTLLECKLYTGRTHQIRVHLQYIKHPVVGDQTYRAHGPKDEKSQLGLERQFLHSYSIGFDHPITGERIEISDGLPEDLECALSKIGGRSLGKTEHAIGVLDV